MHKLKQISPLKKPPKLPPLALSDIITTLIRTQPLPDLTPTYKHILASSYLPNNHHIHDNDNINGMNVVSLQEQLPYFAKVQLKQPQILAYLIINKIRNYQQYYPLLHKVTTKISVAMQEYSGKIQQSQQYIQQVTQQLYTLCERIYENRRIIKESMVKIERGYAKIGPTLRKINNIKKVLQIVQIYNSNKIPYLFSIDLQKPYLYHLRDILGLFKEAERSISETVVLEQSGSLKKMLEGVRQKHKRFVKNVQMQFVDSAINFKSIQQYKIKFTQYLQLLQQNPQIQTILTESSLKKTIKQNSNKIFISILMKLTPSLKVDLLNQSVYLSFYEQLLQEYITYYRNWHLITSFHLDNSQRQKQNRQQHNQLFADVDYGQLFLQNRKLVFTCSSDIISKSIQNSGKFISLQYSIKLQLVQKFQQYIQAGQKWMGNCQGLGLAKVVTQKLCKQLDNIFGLYNNLIKNVLTQELSVSALETVEQPMSVLNVKVPSQLPQINYEKISVFLGANSSATTRIYNNGTNSNSNGTIGNSNNRKYIKLQDPPKVYLKIGVTFVQMICQYLQRAKYMQNDKAVYISKMVQHFQFILFMMYQVCIQSTVKQKINNTNNNISSSPSQVVDYQQPSLLNPSQSNTPSSLKSLTHTHNKQYLLRTYSQLLKLIKSIGNRYDGVKVASIIDVNKVYTSNSDDIVNRYSKMVVRVINQMGNILEWVKGAVQAMGICNINMNNMKVRGNGKNSKEKGSADFMKIGVGLKLMVRLVIQGNMSIVSTRYLQNVGPIVNKLKWQIKKFNSDTAAMYKQYKLKMLQIFRKSTLLLILRSDKISQQIIQIVADKQVQTFYRSLLQVYGKIQKINDNGRQLIRMDSVQISKVLIDLGILSQMWPNWFDKYMDLTAERSYKSVLQKVNKISMMYEPVCWRYALMWVIGDMSSKEKKEYVGALVNIYTTQRN